MALCVGHYLFWRHHAKRFQVVRPGVLYRVGQPTEFGLRHLMTRYGIRTVLSLQLYEMRLRSGLYDVGPVDGQVESEFVAGMGVRHLRWPMGEEACWPWPTPWQFEEFFKLIDEPENWPILVHCTGGRHRTGTIAALFRLEYDRWPAQRALDEMYSFEFGPASPMQERNLRTYLPRPLPSDAQWNALAAELFEPLGGVRPADYAELVRRLIAARDRPEVRSSLEAYFGANKPFAMPLASRLIARGDDPLTPIATRLAVATLKQSEADAASWSSAAAWIADFGAPEDQQSLLERLAIGAREPRVSPQHAAVVAGVMNRYTTNRLAYLRPLLDDERIHPEPALADCRYCDTAVARVAAITDQVLMPGVPVRSLWDSGRQLARDWYQSHPDEVRLTQLIAPAGKNEVRLGDSSREESQTRLRR